MSRVSTNITSILSISSMASTSLMSSVKAEEMLGMEPNSTIELIHVVGTSIPRAALPGSSTRLSSEDIAKFKYQDVMRLMRQVPGINIQEEDGLGLRPNIGLRGSGVERSGKITLMEDGILIAPAAYAAPSAYYFPTAARMQAVEVFNSSATNILNRAQSEAPLILLAMIFLMNSVVLLTVGWGVIACALFTGL